MTEFLDDTPEGDGKEKKSYNAFENYIGKTPAVDKDWLLEKHPSLLRSEVRIRKGALCIIPINSLPTDLREKIGIQEVTIEVIDTWDKKTMEVVDGQVNPGVRKYVILSFNFIGERNKVLENTRGLFQEGDNVSFSEFGKLKGLFEKGKREPSICKVVKIKYNKNKKKRSVTLGPSFNPDSRDQVGEPGDVPEPTID